MIPSDIKKVDNVLYKQKKQEEMEKQGEKVQEQILSTAPLKSNNIGPIRPVLQTTAKGLNRTGVVIPGSECTYFSICQNVYVDYLNMVSNRFSFNSNQH